MIFHADKKDMRFEIAGIVYEVPKGCDVDIPDRVAYCVASNGLPLKSGTGGGKLVHGKQKPSTKPPVFRSPQPSVIEAQEELADVTGEDPVEEGGIDVDDASDGLKAAELTFEELKRRGISLPGAFPGRRPRKGK